MHIPSGMIHGAVCPVTAIVAATGIGGAALAAAKSENKPDVARFASVSALIFAAQMINFPIQSGTSGHLLGGVLAAALLGVPFGILAISIVLAVQCLLFSDGGILVLGANVVNMSLIGAGLGGMLAGRPKDRSPAYLARLGFAASMSVVVAALACSIELALSGAVPLRTSAAPMLGTHAMIGMGEALITVTAFVLFYAPARSRESVLAPAAAAIVIALVLSPFASGFPDGLEWVAGRLGIPSAPAFVAPLADYSLSSELPAALSTGLAGLAGVVVVFAVAWATSLMWKSRQMATPRLPQP